MKRESNIYEFPENKARLPTPHMETLKEDIATFLAFQDSAEIQLPRDPNLLADAVRSEGLNINVDSINWFNRLTHAEALLVQSGELWYFDDNNRPISKSAQYGE